jgi:hypothetical protein
MCIFRTSRVDHVGMGEGKWCSPGEGSEGEEVWRKGKASLLQTSNFPAFSSPAALALFSSLPSKGKWGNGRKTDDQGF